MSLGMWEKIKYKGVPSICMHNNAKIFEKHDEKRFLAYLDDVKQGKKSIKAETLTPDMIINKAIGQDSEVAELQWGELVKKSKLKLANMMKNTAVVLDACQNVAISLTLFFIELSEGY